MKQVDFYILENEDSNGKLKYTCRLAHKGYNHGLKILIQTRDKKQSEQLDTLLWTFSQGSFIPHSIAAEEELDWQSYPVQLSDIPVLDTSGTQNNFDMLINLREEPMANEKPDCRVAEIVCNEARDKNSARNRYRNYKEQGIVPNTHHIS